jgi:glutamyl-tRNA reductase
MSRKRSAEPSTPASVGSARAADASTPGVLSGVCISHDTASVDDIESVDRFDQQTMLTGLLAHDPVAEALALKTCHRVEAYVVTPATPVGRRVLTEFTPNIDSAVVVEMGHEESLRHLLRVAAGLESLVLGEDQILGQVRDAYIDAREVGTIGSVLEPAVLKAIRVGERARTETSINDGVRSIGSATVAFADEQCDLDGRAALVIGAGQIGSLTANAFADSGIETLYIANRSVSRAEAVVDDVDLGDARAIGLDALPAVLADADVVVSATSSAEYLLDGRHLETAGTTTIIDAARPRDVSPTVSRIQGVSRHGLGALESVIDETRRHRQSAVAAVETIVDREFERLQKQYRRKRADEVIAAMYEQAAEIKSRQVSKALARIEAQGDDREARREIIDSLADALLSHLLADPTATLRAAAEEGDWTMLETAAHLFASGSASALDRAGDHEDAGGPVPLDRYRDDDS